MEISEQLTPRFSSGCILCGRMDTWRFKMFDPENRQYWICVDCLMAQRKLGVKNVRNEVSEGKGMEKPEHGIDRNKDTEQPIEGKEPESGKKLKNDVEG